MKFSHRFFTISMYITLIIIGIIQFFEFPKYLNYILLAVAIIFGTIGIIIKFKHWKAE